MRRHRTVERDEAQADPRSSAPETRPAVVPPLGWALSTFSTDSLEAALQDEKGNCDRGKKAEYRPVNLCALLALAE